MALFVVSIFGTVLDPVPYLPGKGTLVPLKLQSVALWGCLTLFLDQAAELFLPGSIADTASNIQTMVQVLSFICSHSSSLILLSFYYPNLLLPFLSSSGVSLLLYLGHLSFANI